MKTIKKVLIMKWNCSPCGYSKIKKQKTKFPKEALILKEWNEKKVIGVAKNFKSTDEGIICDIKIMDKELNYSNTIAPAISRSIGTKNEDLEILHVALIKEHITKELNNNMLKVHK